jgi:hypothetical protein
MSKVLQQAIRLACFCAIQGQYGPAEAMRMDSLELEATRIKTRQPILAITQVRQLLALG